MLWIGTIGLQNLAGGMQLKPTLERQLREGQHRELRTLEFAGHGFTAHLTPPGARRGIFEHGVEVIHPDEAEALGLAIDHRLVHAAGAAHVAIGHHHGPSAHDVAHLMMVQNETHRVSAGLAIKLHADHH